MGLSKEIIMAIVKKPKEIRKIGKKKKKKPKK